MHCKIGKVLFQGSRYGSGCANRGNSSDNGVNGELILDAVRRWEMRRKHTRQFGL